MEVNRKEEEEDFLFSTTKLFYVDSVCVCVCVPESERKRASLLLK